MAPLPLPPPLLSMYRLVSLDESTGHKLSPARKVPSSTWGPLETALPGASCFQLRGHQAHLLPSLSGGHACSICHHGPALCKVLWSRRKSSCPCSEDYDLGGRIRWRKKKAKWVLMMAVDSGTQKSVHLSTSWALAVVSAYLQRWGAHHLLRKPILLLGSSTLRKLLLNVGQNLSYDFSLV